MYSHAFHKKVMVGTVQKCIVMLYQVIIFNQETIDTEIYFHYWNLGRPASNAPKYILTHFD